MEIVRIDRASGAPLEVPARLLSESDAHSEIIEGTERGYQLFLYATDSGYIAGVRILADGEGERTHQVVEVVESAKDVENFFFVFEPAEHLPEAKLQSLTEDQRSHVASRLLEIYEQQVAQILAALPAKDPAKADSALADLR